MKVGLAITGNVDIIKSNLITQLSDDLNDFFLNKGYGNGIKRLTIGIVCVKPEFEQFFKPVKPKYTKGKKQINQDGIPFVLEDDFEYRIKLCFEQFTSADELTSKEILADEILKSLPVFDKFEDKIKDFNFVGFKEDLKVFFDQYINPC